MTTQSTSDLKPASSKMADSMPTKGKEACACTQRRKSSRTPRVHNGVYPGRLLFVSKEVRSQQRLVQLTAVIYSFAQQADQPPTDLRIGRPSAASFPVSEMYTGTPSKPNRRGHHAFPASDASCNA